MRCRIYLSVLSFLFASILFGQKFQYTIYSGESLPFTQVNQTVEDHLGYIWLATDQGLFRFDGLSFEDYNTRLVSRYIHAFAKGEDSGIFFSNDTGVYGLNYTESGPSIEPLIETSTNTEGLTYPDKLLLDKNNRLWISQLEGTLFSYDLDEGKLETHQIPGSKNTDEIHIGTDGEGRVWLLAPDLGVYHYNEQSAKFEKSAPFIGYEHLLVMDDRLYLAGRVLLDLRITEEGKLANTRRLVSSDMTVSYVNQDATGLLYLVSEGVLFTIATKTRKLQQVFGSNDPHRVENLPALQVNHIGFSSDQLRRGGKIWISSEN